jgi:hypothetical protein
VLVKISKNVNDPKFVGAYLDFMSRVSSQTVQDTINKLRDIALSIENIDVDLAANIMALILPHRPAGPLIKRKIKEYVMLLRHQKS